MLVFCSRFVMSVYGCEAWCGAAGKAGGVREGAALCRNTQQLEECVCLQWPCPGTSPLLCTEMTDLSSLTEQHAMRSAALMREARLIKMGRLRQQELPRSEP